MGRQFRFYLLPSDANSLVQQLQQRFQAKLLLDYSPSSELFVIDSPFRRNQTGELKPVTKAARFYLVPPSARVGRRYCPKPGWWAIDSKSEGIAFSGCKFDGETLFMGRFWYQTGIAINLQWVSRSARFLAWAEAVYQYTKKFLHYDRGIEAYVGKDAMSFRQTGGQFASMIRADGRIIRV